MPIQVFHDAAAVADEMMMARAFGIKPRGAAFNGYFPHQARLHQIPQVVISGGAGTARVQAIDAFKDFGSRWMSRMLQQKSYHCVALRRIAQSALFEGTFNLRSVHKELD